MESGDFSKTDSLPISDSANSEMFVNVIEVNADGWVSKLRLRIEELLGYFAQIETGEARVDVACFRDLVIFSFTKRPGLLILLWHCILECVTPSLPQYFSWENQGGVI